MSGRARQVFDQHWEAAGLSEGPPRGALAGYSEETLGRILVLRARCSEADDEQLHALRECESAAAGLLAWIEQEGAAPRRAKTARATKTLPTPAAQAPAVTRLAARAAARRAAMRSRR